MRLKQKMALTESTISIMIQIDGDDVAGTSIPADLTLEEMRAALARAIEGVNQNITERDAALAAETNEANNQSEPADEERDDDAPSA